MSENHLYSKDRHRAGMRKLSYSMTCTTRLAHLSPPGDCFEQLHSFRVGCDCSKKGLTDWLKTAAEHLNTLWIIMLPCGFSQGRILKNSVFPLCTSNARFHNCELEKNGACDIIQAKTF